MMTDDLAEDLLEGAAAIAAYLGPTWDEKRVFNARQRKRLPIRKGGGMGLYAFKSELRAALQAPETLKS